MEKQMTGLGKHIIAEFYSCDNLKINDIENIEQVFLKSAKDSGATIVESKFHAFSPHGISGVVVISESHLTIHTWPEYGYAAVDIFTCGDLIDNNKCLQMIKEGLGSEVVSITELIRGALLINE